MTTDAQVRPRLEVLKKAQIERIHEYSLRILSTIGVRVDSARARKLFAQASGSHVTEDHRVRISPELVDWALHTAPSSVDVYDRTGHHAFRLPGPTRFGIGVTSLYYHDPETRDVLPFARHHMETMVRLGDGLSSFDAVSTIGIIQDVPPERSDLVAALEMAANTTKPLVILVSDERAFPYVLDLLESMHGDLPSRPFVLPYFNPISPLVINEGTVDKMWFTVERGLPFIYSNYGMAGASAPITPGGSLILLNAELLAGLALGQLIKEGSPMILGSLPACFDMKGMGSFYSVQSYVAGLACAEMMAYYGLPHCGTSGSGIGWGADLIAAGHQWLNHLVSCIGKVGLAPFVGDVLGSLAFSPEVVVYADEVIEQARLFAAGFAIDDVAVGLDDIMQVGPGGDFLTSDLTLKLFRHATYRSKPFPNLTLDQWRSRGKPRAGEELRHHTLEILSGLKPPADWEDVAARGEEFLAGFDDGLV